MVCVRTRERGATSQCSGVTAVTPPLDPAPAPPPAGACLATTVVVVVVTTVTVVVVPSSRLAPRSPPFTFCGGKIPPPSWWARSSPGEEAFSGCLRLPAVFAGTLAGTF